MFTLNDLHKLLSVAGLHLQDQRLQTYQQLLQPVISSNPSSVDASTVARSQQYHMNALQDIADVSALSVTPAQANKLKRDRLMQSLEDFLDTELAGLGLTLHTCGPLDILVFLSAHHIPSHSGSLLHDGTVQMAPSSVANCISQLSVGFDLLGRGNAWVNGTGNPALASSVKRWYRGYTRKSTAAGFKITGAQVAYDNPAVRLTSNKKMLHEFCCCAELQCRLNMPVLANQQNACLYVQDQMQLAAMTSDIACHASCN